MPPPGLPPAKHLATSDDAAQASRARKLLFPKRKAIAQAAPSKKSRPVNCHPAAALEKEWGILNRIAVLKSRLRNSGYGHSSDMANGVRSTVPCGHFISFLTNHV